MKSINSCSRLLECLSAIMAAVARMKISFLLVFIKARALVSKHEIVSILGYLGFRKRKGTSLQLIVMSA